MKSLSRLTGLCLDKQIPFVCFRLPGTRTFHTWIQRTGSVQFFESFDDVPDETGYVYAPFHRKTDFPVVFFTGEIRLEGDRIDDSLLQDLERMGPLYPKRTDPLPGEISKKEYLNQANAFIRAFGDTLSKAVLSRVILRKKPDGFLPGELMQTLANAYPNAFVHLIFIPGNGVWMGATPELLYHREGDACYTEALAGTLAYDEENTIRWEQKEKEEQEMVTRYIESLMEMKGIRSYSKEEPKTIKAGKLIHLKTGFHFKTGPSFNEGSFIRALHPTPAVCGLPKEEALELILRTEPHNREYYAGFCGPVNFEGTTRLYVNLRCMKVFEDHLALYAGGGLTARSDPEKEWEETELKARTLLSMI